MTTTNNREDTSLYSIFYDDQTKYDRCVGRVLGLYISIHITNMVIKQTELIPSTYLSLVMGLIFITYLCYKRKVLFFPSGITKFFVLEAISISLIAVSCFRYGDFRNEILARCIHTVVFCVPFFVFFSKIESKRIVLEQGIIPSIYVLLLSAVVYFFRRTGQTSYNMPLGYALLFPTSVFWIHRRRGKVYYLLFLIGITEIALIGSRGPLLCVFILFSLTLLSGWKNTKEFIEKILVIICLGTMLINIQSILLALSEVLNKIGINSRTLILALEKGITNDSGRSGMQDMVWKAIVLRPLLGYGVGGDIAILGFYPHNVFLEMLFDFGVVIGLAICVMICIRIIVNVKQINREEKECFFLFIACGIVPLLMSDTYLQWPFFWMLIGVCKKKMIRCKIT